MDEGSGSAEGYLPEIAREDMAKSPRPLGLLTEMIPTTLSFFPNTISTNVCVHIATPHHKGCPHHLIQSIKTGLLGGLSLFRAAPEAIQVHVRPEDEPPGAVPGVLGLSDV